MAAIIHGPKWILPAAAATILAVIGALWLTPSSGVPAAAGQALPTDKEIRAFQAQANAACRCARGRAVGPESDACWADLERDLARYPHSEETSLCGPESETRICFEGAGDLPERCFHKQWTPGACDLEEAVTLKIKARSGTGCG